MGISTQREVFKAKVLTPAKPKQRDLKHPASLYEVDLAFSGKETRHSTHVLHPYVAAINPPLVKALIDAYIPVGENILDPYAGGGGVLVESILNNRPSAGAEINPLGVLLSKAKTTYIPRESILKFGEKLLKKALQEKILDLSVVDKKIAFWFREETLKEIVALSNALKYEVGAPKLKTLFQVILSGTIRDVMLTYRGEVRLRKLQGKDFDKFHPKTFDVFKKRYTLAAERVSSLPRTAKSDIELRDIRKLPFKNKEFYGIICSPPYADDKNGVGYFQFSKNMLSFLGYSPDQIKDYRSLFLGMVKENKLPPHSKSLHASLKNVKKIKPEKYSEAVAFYSDYELGLKEMVRVTRKRIIIVIGNRVLARTEFNNAAITVELLESMGVKLEHHHTRILNKKRIPNLGSDGGGINLEHILVFKK